LQGGAGGHDIADAADDLELGKGFHKVSPFLRDGFGLEKRPPAKAGSPQAARLPSLLGGASGSPPASAAGGVDNPFGRETALIVPSQLKLT
ncbi:hypothetical protein, partial [Terrabacter sp. 2RAF25]|uniref:hypothetical protein n=1 Tax=Terrabacter sp. 2RAF25 TaxID=3232998 RepID=UPI003F9B6A07